MSRTSSTFVSPNLAPTTEWCQQTSTGVFRPPPALHLQPSNTGNCASLAADRHSDPRQPYLLPATTAQKDRDHGLESSSEASAGLAGGGIAGGWGTGPDRAAGGGGFGVGSSSATPMAGSWVVPPHGPSPPLPPMMPLPSSPHDSLPVIMKMIRFAIHAEQDSYLSQKEINRVLEGELQREQEQRRATSEQLAVVSKSLTILEEIAKAQKAAIAELQSLQEPAS